MTDTTKRNEELKHKYDTLWNNGKFSMNEDVKQGISLNRLWNVFIVPLIAAQDAEKVCA